MERSGDEWLNKNFGGAGGLTMLGSVLHNIDAKGRIIIPLKFREILGDNFIITKGLDRCLFAYTMSEWEIISDKIKSLPVTDPSARKFSRFFFGGATTCIPDKQGRVSIPQNLQEYASINKEIVSVGLVNRLEIWSAENWTDYSDESFIDDELAMHVSNLGI